MTDKTNGQAKEAHMIEKQFDRLMDWVGVGLVLLASLLSRG